MRRTHGYDLDSLDHETHSIVSIPPRSTLQPLSHTPLIPHECRRDDTTNDDRVILIHFSLRPSHPQPTRMENDREYIRVIRVDVRTPQRPPRDVLNLEQRRWDPIPPSLTPHLVQFRRSDERTFVARWVSYFVKEPLEVSSCDDKLDRPSYSVLQELTVDDLGWLLPRQVGVSPE